MRRLGKRGGRESRRSPNRDDGALKKARFRDCNELGAQKTFFFSFFLAKRQGARRVAEYNDVALFESARRCGRRCKNSKDSEDNKYRFGVVLLFRRVFLFSLVRCDLVGEARDVGVGANAVERRR